MPEVQRLDDYPNILKVGGSTIHQYDEDYRRPLRDYLHGLNSRQSPVRRGTHDFWITYPYPPLVGHGANHSWEDMEITPRPLRGIVEMTDVPVRQLPDDHLASIRDEMHTLLQEVGHHWLVPSQLRFRNGNRVMAAPEIHDLVSRINRGTFPDTPPLLGRTGNHWSVFTEADDSPLDGQAYRKIDDWDGLNTWESTSRRHRNIDIRGDDSIGSLRLRSAFNDMELFLMGVLERDNLYPNNSPKGEMQWLEPRITAPYDYQVGLFVAFGNGDYYTFGFHQRPDVLAATSTDGDHEEVNIGNRYRPFTSAGMVLRIVRRGNHYYFQARQDTPYTDLEHESVHGIFDDFNALPEPSDGGDWQRFRTVAHWEHSDTPLAIGLMVRRWGSSFLAEGRFYNLELKKGAGSQGWNLNSIPRDLRQPPTYTDLPTEILHYYHPAGVIRRINNNRMYLTLPFSTNAPSQEDGFKHYRSFDNDRAPKLFFRPEPGDFAFGSSVRVSRVIPTPWAGGDIDGKTMWGEAKSIPARQLIIPEGWDAKRTAPTNNRYRCAFIVVAKDTDDIPDDVVRDLDLVRRYWDSAFYAATRLQRRSLSAL